jgi:type III pantothenate kinase
MEAKMLLVIDVGNTNTVMGIYHEQKLIKDWRIRTERKTTEDEFNVIVTSLLTIAGIDADAIRQTVISCVVPPMVTILDSFCLKYLGHAPRWVDARSYTRMPILINNPSELGADRIVNSVAAYQKYGQSLIIIDFGTATTFDVVSDKGEYLGGAISPGIMIASEALFREASKLPRVEIFERPDNVVGKDSTSSIKSGIIFGYAGLVDGIVGRIKAQMESVPLVLATGGLAPLMADVAKSIEKVESSLTLEGLRIISEDLT